MCVLSKPKPPAVALPQAPVTPQAPAAAPQAQDPAVSSARDNERRRKMRASSENNTLVSGGAGLTAPAQTATKSLYGQ